MGVVVGSVTPSVVLDVGMGVVIGYVTPSVVLNVGMCVVIGSVTPSVVLDVGMGVVVGSVTPSVVVCSPVGGVLLSLQLKPGYAEEQHSVEIKETVLSKWRVPSAVVVIGLPVVDSVATGVAAVDVLMSSSSHPLVPFPQQSLEIVETVLSNSVKNGGGGMEELSSGVVGVIVFVAPPLVSFSPAAAVVIFGSTVAFSVVMDGTVVNVLIPSSWHSVERFPQQSLTIFKTVSSKSVRGGGGGMVGIELYTIVVGVVESMAPSLV